MDPFSRAGKEQLCQVTFRIVLQETAQCMRLKQLIQNWSPVMIILSLLSHSLLCPHSQKHLVKKSFQLKHRHCISAS